MRNSERGFTPAASHPTSSSRDCSGVISIWSRAMRIPDAGGFDRARTALGAGGAGGGIPPRGEDYHPPAAASLMEGASWHEQPSRSSSPQSFVASASDSFEPTCFSIAAEYEFHIFFCNSRPASVISTNWPRLSILHSRRAANPSSTSRSISREVEYCGSSICFSNSTGRISPVGARDSSNNASYQASGGKPAFLSSCSTASSTRLCTRIRRIQAAVASVDGLRFMVSSISDAALYRTKCSCINLDYCMQMHLIVPHHSPTEEMRHEIVLFARSLFAVAAHRAA